MFPVRSIAIQKILRRADFENTTFVASDELIDLANDNLEIAYHKTVAAYGDTVFASEYFISGIGQGSTPATTWPTAVGGAVAESSRFTLPPDFGRLIRCEFVDGALTPVPTLSGAGVVYELAGKPDVRWTPMHPFQITGSIYDSTPRDWMETQVAYWISSHPGPTLPTTLNAADVVTKFWVAFLPVPAKTVSVHIQYVPEAPAWGTDDTGVIRLPDLAWKFVREATAADLLEKQRSDASALRANAAAYLADIENSKLAPDFANAAETIDLYGGSGVPPYGRRRQVW